MTQTWGNHLEVKDIGTVVKLVDRTIVDERNIQALGDQLFSLVDVQEKSRIVLDFGNVEYLSAAALGKFITLQEKLEGVGGKLVMANVDSRVKGVFESTRLDNFFTFCSTEQEALATLGTASVLPKLAQHGGRY